MQVQTFEVKESQRKNGKFWKGLKVLNKFIHKKCFHWLSKNFGGFGGAGPTNYCKKRAFLTLLFHKHFRYVPKLSESDLFKKTHLTVGFIGFRVLVHDLGWQIQTKNAINLLELHIPVRERWTKKLEKETHKLFRDLGSSRKLAFSLYFFQP